MKELKRRQREKRAEKGTRGRGGVENTSGDETKYRESNNDEDSLDDDSSSDDDLNPLDGEFGESGDGVFIDLTMVEEMWRKFDSFAHCKVRPRSLFS
jgi:hypothetical protein